VLHIVFRVFSQYQIQRPSSSLRYTLSIHHVHENVHGLRWITFPGAFDETTGVPLFDFVAQVVVICYWLGFGYWVAVYAFSPERTRLDYEDPNGERCDFDGKCLAKSLL
jgi:hypothetical protein